MDQIVERECVDPAGVVAREALSDVFVQPRELSLVVRADRRARGAPLRLRWA
jgi:hypothetical protein